MPKQSAIRFWIGIGLGVERRMNRYGGKDFWLILPLAKIRLTKDRYYNL